MFKVKSLFSRRFEKDKNQIADFETKPAKHKRQHIEGRKNWSGRVGFYSHTIPGSTELFASHGHLCTACGFLNVSSTTTVREETKRRGGETPIFDNFKWLQGKEVWLPDSMAFRILMDKSLFAVIEPEIKPEPEEPKYWFGFWRKIRCVSPV